MAGILEIEDVYTAYDKADVLQGVSLNVEAEPHHLSARLQRLRQDHLGALDPRPDAGTRRPHRIQRHRHHSAANTQDHRRGHRVHSRGAQGVSQAYRGGKPAGRRISGKLGQGHAARLAEILQIFPRLAERRTQLAGTMSGGDRRWYRSGRGTHVRAQAAPDRRAVAWAVSAAREGKFRHPSVFASTSAVSPCFLSSRMSIRPLRFRTMALCSRKDAWRQAVRRQNLQPARTCAMLILDRPCSPQLN